MQERERRLGQGDVQGPTRGDFTDWDNPEDDLDELEDAPEGYYDDEAAEEEFELSPDDPDYDLSEAAGYSGWDGRRRTGIPQWALITFAFLLIASLLLPLLLRFS